MSVRAAVALGAGLVALLGAACDGARPNTCFDSNAYSYGFSPAADTTLVFRWPADRMPVRFYADTGVMRANVLASLTLWVNAFHCQEASFQLAGDSTTADVIIRAVTLLPPVAPAAFTLGSDSVGACVGRTDFAIDPTGTLTGPFRSFIAPQAVGDTAAVAGCSRMTTTHEIGHTLGIFTHSPHPTDLMYPTPRRSDPSPDDRYTLQRLYHTPATVHPAPRTR